MPSTPATALPYPALTDAPNSPQQLQALAERIEARYPRGAVALARFGTSVTATGATIVYSHTFTALAGRLYRVTFSLPVLDDQSGTSGTFNGSVDLYIRGAAGTSVTTTGTILGFSRVGLRGDSSNNAHGTTVVGYLNNPAAGSYTVGLSLTPITSTAVRVLPPGTDPAQGAQLLIDDIGAAVA